MGKISKRKFGARRYADYSQETLKVAVDLVKSKALSSYEAEKQFGIPRRTILNKCKNRHDKAIGRPLELSAEEEGHIAEVIEVAADFGSPLTIMDLRIVVYNHLEKCGKTELFKGRMPGERWARNFLERHSFTHVLSEIDCHALSATNFPRTAARRRVNVLSSPISQRTDVTKSDNTDLSDSKMSQNQCEPNFSQDQSEISTQDESCLMISTWNNSKTVSFHHISEPNQPVNSESQASRPPISEDSIFNIIKSDDAVSDKILSPSNSDDEQTSFDYSVNDKVLVRYYTKNKKWKYYIGVITACNIDQTFDISFYIMTRNKGELIFKKPKKVDRDTVPKMLIEKIIKIDKISDKPEEYKLHEQEDATYF